MNNGRFGFDDLNGDWVHDQEAIYGCAAHTLFPDMGSPTGGGCGACLKLASELGSDTYQLVINRQLPIEWKPLLEKLAGPHGHTILKIHKLSLEGKL